MSDTFCHLHTTQMTVTRTPSPVRRTLSACFVRVLIDCIVFSSFIVDWEIWTAGLVTSTSVRDMLVSSVRKYAADGKSSQPLGDWYETKDGSVKGFRARPVAGGHLALVSTPSLLSSSLRLAPGLRANLLFCSLLYRKLHRALIMKIPARFDVNEPSLRSCVYCVHMYVKHHKVEVCCQ